MTADFFFAVVFVILIPLAIICTACVVGDTVLAILNYHDARYTRLQYTQEQANLEPQEETQEEVKTDD